MNSMWLYPQALMDEMVQMIDDVLQPRTESVGPVYQFTAPMLDRAGGVIRTVGWWQAFYNTHGEFSWCVTIFDRWAMIGNEPPPQLPLPSALGHQEQNPAQHPPSHHQPQQHHQHHSLPPPPTAPSQAMDQGSFLSNSPLILEDPSIEPFTEGFWHLLGEAHQNVSL